MSNAEINHPETDRPAPPTTAVALGEAALARILYLPGHEPSIEEPVAAGWNIHNSDVFALLHIDFTPKIPKMLPIRSFVHKV